MSPDELFLALGNEIPPPVAVPPNLSFTPIRLSHGVAWLAGHGPNRVKQPPEFDYVGKVGAQLTAEEGYAAARLVGLNLLVTLRAALGSLNRVTQILQLSVGVNCVPGFVRQSFVANGCSDLMVQIFAAAGAPARMAFGAAEMPFGMAVEANLVVEYSPPAVK